MKDLAIELANLNRELYHLEKTGDKSEIRSIKTKIKQIENFMVQPAADKEPFFDGELVFKIVFFASIVTLFYLIIAL
jgi:hypothetical protein